MAEKPEDFNLPVSVVTRLLKEALPDGVNVSKEARAALAKAASIFVLYSTSCANNFAVQAKRKTVTGPDVISAMEGMEFGSFTERLQENLEAFRKDKYKRDSDAKAKKEKADKAKQSKTSEEAENMEEDASQDES